MTCKDCLCCDVCAYLHDTESVDFDEINPLACNNFKPKSSFVELPCEVGQTVYRVSFVHKTVTPLKVEGFIRNLTSWKVHCTHLIPSWVGNQKEHIYIAFSSFGKTAFLDPAKAEKALKEREANDT